MKRGTKIGWLLVAFSLILSVWVIVSQKSDASTTTSEGFVISDDGTVLEGIPEPVEPLPFRMGLSQSMRECSARRQLLR